MGSSRLSSALLMCCSLLVRGAAGSTVLGSRRQAHAEDVGPERLSHPLVILICMSMQLTLLESPAGWRLDERTREVGRRGLAEARAALLAARARELEAAATADAA